MAFVHVGSSVAVDDWTRHYQLLLPEGSACLWDAYPKAAWAFWLDANSTSPPTSLPHCAAACDASPSCTGFEIPVRPERMRYSYCALWYHGTCSGPRAVGMTTSLNSEGEATIETYIRCGPCTTRADCAGPADGPDGALAGCAVLGPQPDHPPSPPPLPTVPASPPTTPPQLPAPWLPPTPQLPPHRPPLYMLGNPHPQAAGHSGILSLHRMGLGVSVLLLSLAGKGSVTRAHAAGATVRLIRTVDLRLTVIVSTCVSLPAASASGPRRRAQKLQHATWLVWSSNARSAARSTEAVLRGRPCAVSVDHRRHRIRGHNGPRGLGVGRKHV